MRLLFSRARHVPALFLACMLSACGGGGGGADAGTAPATGNLAGASAPVMRCAP